MSRLKIFSTIFIAAFISACGAEATPTINAVDVQNTAISGAFTLVAQTEAAIPTATPLPPTSTPTQTPLPTNTPLALPTLDVTLTPTIASQGGGNSDPCNVPLTGSVAGRPTMIRLVNVTKAPVLASIYLNLTSFGSCGYRGYNLSAGDSVTITDLPQGCYNVSVFVNDPKKPSRAFGYGCINNSDKWTFEIRTDSVKFTGP